MLQKQVNSLFSLGVKFNEHVFDGVFFSKVCFTHRDLPYTTSLLTFLCSCPLWRQRADVGGKSAVSCKYGQLTTAHLNVTPSSPSPRPPISLYCETQETKARATRQLEISSPCNFVIQVDLAVRAAATCTHSHTQA